MIVLDGVSALGQLVGDVVNVSNLEVLGVYAVGGGYVFALDVFKRIVVIICSEGELSIAYVDLLLVLTVNGNGEAAVLGIVIDLIFLDLGAADYDKLIYAVLRNVDRVHELGGRTVFIVVLPAGGVLKHYILFFFGDVNNKSVIEEVDKGESHHKDVALACAGSLEAGVAAVGVGVPRDELGICSYNRKESGVDLHRSCKLDISSDVLSRGCVCRKRGEAHCCRKNADDNK